MFLASIPLAGLLLLATPQQSPDPAPLDPLLTSAIDRLQRSTGHRFDADGIELLPFDPSAPLACARGPMNMLNKLADVVAAATTTEIRARFERGKPLLLATGSIQAFRDDGKVVFRRRIPGARGDDSKWSPWTDLNDVGDFEERIELRLLRLVARLPTPEELLGQLAARATSCTATADPKREGRIAFKCQIRPDAGWKLSLDNSPGGNCRWEPERAQQPAPASLQRCTLRIVVERGASDFHIVELGIEVVATPDTSPSAIPVTVRYRIHDVGATKVVVPDEVARRLGGR